MKIRRYRDQDQDAVWFLHSVAMKATKGAHAENESLYKDLHNIRETYLNSGGEFLVAVKNNQIIAMGALAKSGSNRAEIKRMRVLPHFQRRGLGQAVLQKLEARAIELGYVTIHLDTTVGQKVAQAFYIQNGYIEVRRSQFCQFDTIIYQKRLTN